MIDPASEQLRLLIERIERLNEDIKGISEDRKDVYAEAKGTGYDVKTIRAVIKRRAMEHAAKQEMDALLETYEVNLGIA